MLTGGASPNGSASMLCKQNTALAEQKVPAAGECAVSLTFPTARRDVLAAADVDVKSDEEVLSSEVWAANREAGEKEGIQ